MLEVRGRRTGKRRRVPVLVTQHEGEQFLVALAGESDWVRNVRTADGHAVLCRRRRRPVILQEVEVDQRAPVLAAYLAAGRERSGPRGAALQARYDFGLTAPDLPRLAGIAHRYPVFHVTVVTTRSPADATTAAEELPSAQGRGPRTVTRVPVPDLCCLWAETGTAPMNIALVGTFDASGPVDDGEAVLARTRSAIARNLDRAPMLRRVLRPTLPGQGRPVWADACDFAIDQHVVMARPPEAFADDQSFLDWCATQTLRSFDRSRPLWRICVVPGLPNRRFAVLVVVHHVVADGLRGVAMIAGLLDADPAGSRTPPAPWRPAPPPRATELVIDNLRDRWRAVRSVRTRTLRQWSAPLQALRAEVRTPAPVTVLGGAIGSGRQLVVVREPLAGLRAAAHRRRCTINDLLLAAVTQGLREMLCPDGDDEAPPLRASIPVGDTSGHRGGMITVLLPVGTADPDDRLRRIVAQTSQRKHTPDGGVAGIVAMPAALARLGVLWARRTAAAHINLYVTNVPGPTFPLYLAGARLLEVVPVAPLVAGVRLSVTALSYDGVLSVALLADQAVTGLPAMTTGVRSGFATYLSAAAGDGRRDQAEAG